MKKFFAILLASIMVLSLVPASIFAADELKCPGADKTHTADNCTATAVETVDANCKEWGYTVYQCLTCNAEYLDDFVKGTGGDHNWVSDPEKAEEDVEPKCGPEAVVGVKHVVCSICGEKAVQHPVKKHDYVLDSKTGYGCTVEETYKCSACGDIKVVEAGVHTWSDRPTAILDEPGLGGDQNVEGINGLAEYTCTVEGCGDTKQVVIIFEHECNYILIDEAVEPTCTMPGNKDTYQCDLCKTYYECVDEADEDAGLEAVYEAREGLEDFILPPAGHKFPQPGDNDYSIEVGDCHVECRVCGEKNADEDVIHGNFRKIAENEASCTTFGFEVWGCTNCGETVIVKKGEDHPALGHVEHTVKVKSTCVSEGYEITYCIAGHHNAEVDGGGTPVTITVNGKKTTAYVLSRVDYENVDLSNHADKKENIIKPAVCEAKGLKIEYCTACGWISDPKQTDATGHSYYEVVTAPTTAATYVINGKEVVFYDIVKVKAPTCLEDGYVEAKCKDCGAEETFVLEATGHDYEVTQKVTNCNGEYYGCYVYEWKKCRNCGDVTHGGVNTLETPLPSVFDTVEDAMKVHGQHIYRYDATSNKPAHEYGFTTDGATSFLPSKVGIHKDPTCTEDGYETLFCPDCGAGIYVTIPALGHNSRNGSVDYKAPGNCIPEFDPDTGEALDKTGNIAYEICSCGQLWYEDNKGNQVEIEEEDTILYPECNIKHYPAVNPTCLDGGNIEYYQCTVCSTYYADANGMPLRIYPGFTPALEALGHDEVVVPENPATCGETGLAGYTICGRCGEILEGGAHYEEDNNGDEYIVRDVLPMLKHVLDGQLMIFLLDHNAKECDIDDCEFCPVDCFFNLYKHYECVLCGYEYIDTYSPNTNGHINDKGNLLEEICTNVVEGGRDCVICGQTFELLHSKHAYAPNGIYVEATCVDFGYFIYYCQNEGCPYREVVENELDPPSDSKHGYETKTNIAQTYVNEGYKLQVCKYCGHEKKTTTPALDGVQYYINSGKGPYCVGATIEVVVSADSFNLSVWGVNYSVAYNKSVVKFLDAENISSKFTYAYEFNNNADTGVVTFAANADGDVSIKGGEDLVKLTFMVIDPAAVEAEFSVANVDIVAKNAKGQNVEAAAGDTVVVNLDKFLNVDGKGAAATMDDAFALYNEYLTGDKTFSACADADFDGEITINDLEIIYKVIVGETTIQKLVDAQLAK